MISKQVTDSAEPHMDGIGVAKEVVQVAENLLVRTSQKDPEDIRLPVGKVVKLEARLAR